MHELDHILNKLEHEMMQLDCWQYESIDPDTLNSTEPFCIDTMSLPQWLQFVLIPRLTALLEGGLPLPSGSGVLPLAEEYFKTHQNAHKLLSAINEMDEVLGKAET